MIKKILGLLIIGFGIISFSSASYVSDNGFIGTIGQFVKNGYINSYQNSVVRKGGLITQVGQVMKNVFYTNTNKFIFWNAHGLPYVFSKNTVGTSIQGQGVPKYYYLCNLITDSISYPNRSNCTSYEISDSSSDTIASFLATLTNSDKFYYNGYSPTNASWVNVLCFSSQSYGNSLCIFQCGSENNDTSGCPTGSKSYMTNSTLGFTTSNSNFDSLDTAVLFDPPGWGGGIIEDNNNYQIDLSCTKQTALNWYERYGYNKNLCYGGLTDYTIYTGTSLGTLPIYGTGEDFEEIWLNTADLRYYGGTGSGFGLDDWFIYWRGLYNLYNRGAYDSNPFLNTPFVLFTYFGAIDAYGSNLDSKSIVEYCELKLYTSDYSVDYTGVNQNTVCSVTNLILNDNYNSNLSGSNGINVFGTGEDIIDGISFVTNFYDILKDKIGDFDSDNNSPILPSYIIWAFIGLLVFRFLSH